MWIPEPLGEGEIEIGDVGFIDYTSMHPPTTCQYLTTMNIS